jgi:hypothetical protein
MKSLRLAVEHTAQTIHPMHAFVCESPVVERELLLEGRTTGDARTLLFFVEGDPEPYEERLAAQPTVTDYELHPQDDGFFLYVRVANADVDGTLLAAFQRDTVVVVPPVAFDSDRTMRIELVGSAEALQGILDDLPDDVGVDVLEIGSTLDVRGATLTDRQRTALRAGWETGYFEVPRTGDIHTVAAELDCAVSTASDLLRRAQARLVADALGEQW